MLAERDIKTSQAVTYTDYSPEQKAAAIAHCEANNGNWKITARQLGYPRDTVRYWFENRERYAQFHTSKRGDLIQKLDERTHLLVDSITPEKIADANLSQIATAAGIMIDKSQLLKGLPTSISENIERNELTVVLADALADAIDVTPE